MNRHPHLTLIAGRPVTTRLPRDLKHHSARRDDPLSGARGIVVGVLVGLMLWGLLCLVLALEPLPAPAANDAQYGSAPR